MRRFGLLAGGAVLAALALAGCGDKQEASKSVDSGETLKILAANVGEKSAAKQTAHLTMTTEVLGQSFEGQGDVRFGNAPAMDFTMSNPQFGEVAMRFIDDTFYVKIPAAEKELGKPWIKIDTKGSDPISKALGTAVEEMKRNGDPAQTLKQLEEYGEITGKKQEQVNGAETTRYTVTTDVKKMVEKQTDPELKKLMQAALDGGMTTLNSDVWLNNENLPVRMTMEFPFTNPADKKPTTVKTTVDYTDWGKAVTVEAPPASEVGELPGR